MSQVRKIAVAAGTFSVALGIGFVMQNGDALAARMGGAVPPAAVNDAADIPVQPAVAEVTELPTLPETEDTPLETVEVEFTPPQDLVTPEMPQLSTEMAALDLGALPGVEQITSMITGSTDEPEIELASGTEIVEDSVSVMPEEDIIATSDCTATLSSTLNRAATVDLSLAAPCATNTGVTIHHQGMIFSLVTDMDGNASVTAPALTPTAVYIADIGGAEGAVTVITVPDVALYDRAVLQWQGDTGLQMHAREFGSAYNEAGHVWQASARDADMALAGEGGFMMRLGNTEMDGAMIAEIYTYPTGMSQVSGQVDLTVEAEVTAANCAREIAAQSIQVSPGEEPIAIDLEMKLPDCDAVGEFLVLNNMLTDLTLASR